MSDERFHVAQVRNSEIATRELRNQGFIVATPTVKVREVVRGNQLRVVIRQMFPGYLLVAFDKIQQRWKAINSTRGVKRLICTAGGEPLALPEKQAGILFAVAAAGPLDLSVENDFFETTWREGLDAIEPGDPVKINGGVHWGQNAIFHKWSDDRARVKLLMTYLGGVRVVTVPAGMIEAAT